MSSVLKEFPVMIIGNKLDLVEENRAQYLMINTKVL